jgi:ATP-binding cassette subfamily F protein 3
VAELDGPPEEALGGAEISQRQIEQLHPEHTPLEHLQQIDPQAREAELRNHLGGFGFSNDMALNPVAPLSGGEKSRLVLSMLIYQRPNLLLLDEPTNHLDLEMRQALAMALQDFVGAMVIVSHDRHLLRVTCDRLLLVHDQCVDDFPQSLDDYPKWLSEQNKQPKITQKGINAEENTASISAASKKDRKRIEAEQRQKLQPLRKKIKVAEEKLGKLDIRKTELEKILASSEIYTEDNKQNLQSCLLEKSDIDKQYDAAENDWIKASEALENMGN